VLAEGTRRNDLVVHQVLDAGDGGDRDDVGASVVRRHRRGDGGDRTREQREHVVRRRQGRVNTHGAVQHVLEVGQRGGVHPGRVDADVRRRLETGDRDRRGGEVPAEGERLRRVVHGAVRLLRRRSHGTPDQVHFVAVLEALDVVTDQRPVRETERLARLLAHGHAGGRLRRPVALGELVGVRERLDGAAEVLVRVEDHVLDVVRVLRLGLSTRRGLRDGGQTVPREAADVVAGVVLEVQDTTVDTRLETAFTDLVPDHSGHG
jgi:hypothetical protein